MARIQRVRVALTGFPGGPGVMTFYALSGADFIAPLREFLLSVAGDMPVDVSLQIESAGDIIEATDGALVGNWTGTAQAPLVGAQAGTYSAATGYVVTWLTGAIADGSRIKGRTFVVPAAGAAFDLTGSIAAATITGQLGFARALIANSPGNFVVWHRPRVAVAQGPGHPTALAAHVGSFVPVTDAIVHDRAAVLRSRRD